MVKPMIMVLVAVFTASAVFTSNANINSGSSSQNDSCSELVSKTLNTNDALITPSDISLYASIDETINFAKTNPTKYQVMKDALFNHRLLGIQRLVACRFLEAENQSQGSES